MPSILIVESEPEFQLLIEKGINQYFTPQIYKAATAQRALAYIRTFILDLIVANANLETGSGFDVLNFLNESHSSTPLILYSRDREIDVIGVEYPNFLGIVGEEDVENLIALVRRFQDSELFKLKQKAARTELECDCSQNPARSGLVLDLPISSKSRRS